MKTEKEIVTGTVYVWALPRTEHEIKTAEDGRSFSYQIGLAYHYRDDAVKVCEVPVSGLVPEGIDLLSNAIETMRECIKKIQDDAERKVTVLEDKIKMLLLIEHQPETTHDD